MGKKHASQYANFGSLQIIKKESLLSYSFFIYTEILSVNKLSFNKFRKIINHLFQIGFIFLI